MQNRLLRKATFCLVCLSIYKSSRVKILRNFPKFKILLKFGNTYLQSPKEKNIQSVKVNPLSNEFYRT